MALLKPIRCSDVALQVLPNETVAHRRQPVAMPTSSGLSPWSRSRSVVCGGPLTSIGALIPTAATWSHGRPIHGSPCMTKSRRTVPFNPRLCFGTSFFAASDQTSHPSLSVHGTRTEPGRTVPSPAPVGAAGLRPPVYRGDYGLAHFQVLGIRLRRVGPSSLSLASGAGAGRRS